MEKIKIRSNKSFELVGVTRESLGYEESAKKLFEVLVYKLPAGVVDSLMRMYKFWDEYTDDWDKPLPKNIDEFFELYKNSENKDE